MALGLFLLMNKTEYFLEKINRKITCSLRIKSPNTKIKIIPHNTTVKHWSEYCLKFAYALPWQSNKAIIINK